MRSRLIRHLEKDGKVKQGRDPENYVENQRAKKFRSTNCQSRTGTVVSGSIVPSLNSSANRRIVMRGKIRTKANQKKTELKNASCTVYCTWRWFMKETWK